MTPNEKINTFCEYTFTAENVKIHIVSGYESLHYISEQIIDSDVFHSHRWYEIFLLEEGDMRWCFQEESILLHAGELLIVRPGTLHYPDDVNISGKPTRINFFFDILDHSDSAPWLQLLSFEKYVIIPFDQECRTLISFFFQAMNHKQGLLAGSYLFAFLTRLSYLQLPCKKDPADSDSDAGRIYRIDRILYQYYKEPISMSDIAKELHLSERQLSRIIEKHYGCSYRKQIVKLRMQEAAVLLTKGISVSDVAYRVGYASVRAFQSAFIKYYGVSPVSLD